MFRQTQGGSGRVITVSTAHGIVAGASMMIRRIAPGISAGYVANGPVSSPEAGAAAAEYIVDAMIATARKLGVRLIALQAPDEAVDRVVAARGFRWGGPSVATDATLLIDLQRSDDELLGQMSRKRRQNIRKATKLGVSVESSQDVELFHRLHSFRRNVEDTLSSRLVICRRNGTRYVQTVWFICSSRPQTMNRAVQPGSRGSTQR